MNEIKHILPVHPENTTGARAITIHAEGRYPSNNGAVTQEIRAARISKARTACVVVI